MADTATTSRLTRRRRGVAAVELALILPVVITIVLGCVDFGRFAYTYIAVTNAAHVGASFASLNPVTSITWEDWLVQVRALVAAEMGSSFDPAKITIAPPVITVEDDGQKRVRVTVSYPFRPLADWWSFLSNREMTLTRAVEHRVIR